MFFVRAHCEVIMIPEKPAAKIFLEAEGIVCSGCAEDMERVMCDMEGIFKVAVSYAKGTIAVTYDPDEIDEAEILAVVKRFGLKVKTLSP